MLKDAFQYLIEVGKSQADVVVKPSPEPAHVYFLRQPDGKLVRQHAEVHPFVHRAESLQPIADMATIDDQIWYSHAAVVLKMGEDLRDRAVLELHASDQYKLLKSWKERKPALSQAELIRELRITLRDSLSQCGELVEILRRVRFNASATIEAEVGHGKASLGKAITGEVTGLKVIPEYVTFAIPVYANQCFRGIREPVECALEPDAATGTFRVIPLPGQLELAIDRGLTEIASQIVGRLDGKKVPLYHGEP